MALRTVKDICLYLYHYTLITDTSHNANFVDKAKFEYIPATLTAAALNDLFLEACSSSACFINAKVARTLAHINQLAPALLKDGCSTKGVLLEVSATEGICHDH